MPRLQLVSVRGVPNVPQPLSGPIQSGFAQGAQGLAGGFGRLAQNLEKVQFANDSIYVAKSMAQLRSASERRMIEGREAAPDGATGFAKQQLTAYDDDARELIEGAPTRRARLLMTQRVETFRPGIESQSLAFEVTSRIKKRTADLQDVMKVNANAILSNPNAYTDALDETKTAIENSALPGAVKRALLESAEQTYAGASIMSRIEKAPGAVLNELQSGKWDKILDPSRKASLMKRARAEIKSAEAKARGQAQADLAGRIKNEIAHLQVTGERSGRVSNEEIRTVYGDKRGQQIIDQINAAEDFVLDRKTIANLSGEDLKAYLESARPDPNSPTLADDTKRYQNLLKAAQSRTQDLVKDPSAYVVRNFPDIAAKGAEAKTPGETQAFAAAVLQAQRRLGLSATQTRILPTAKAEELARELAAVKDPNQLAEKVREMEATYGDYFPKVMTEIRKEGKIADGLGVMPLIVSDTARRDFAVAMSIGSQTLNKDMESLDRKTVNEEVLDRTKGIRETLRLQGGGAAEYERLRNGVDLLAKYYVRDHGMSPSEAADKAAKAFIDDRYHVQDSYRIPKVLDGETRKVAANPKAIKATLRRVQQNIDRFPLDLSKVTSAYSPRPAPGMVGVDTGVKTKAGRPLYLTPEGEMVSEKSITVVDPRLNGGKPTNIPSIWGGKKYDEDGAVREALKSGQTFESFRDIGAAVAAAKERSKGLLTPEQAKAAQEFASGPARRYVQALKRNLVPVTSRDETGVTLTDEQGRVLMAKGRPVYFPYIVLQDPAAFREFAQTRYGISMPRDFSTTVPFGAAPAPAPSNTFSP